jgi:uncharacterized coiled-coil DUF342 family protein
MSLAEENKMLKKQIEEQGKQIDSLRKALEVVNKKILAVDRKLSNSIENSRRMANDLNTVKVRTGVR